MRSDDESTRSLFDLITRMLEYDPAQRITLEQALNHVFFKLDDTDGAKTAITSLRKMPFFTWPHCFRKVSGLDTR